MTSHDRVTVNAVYTDSLRLDVWGDSFVGEGNEPHGKGRTVVFLDAGQAMALARKLTATALQLGWREPDVEDLA